MQISGVDANFAERARTSPGLLTQPQSNITVRSNAEGAAGNIFLNAATVTLADQGQIIAESSTVNGGNISLDLDNFLLLRTGSQITATAGTSQSGGNGGNIIIKVPFIVALPSEDSDIIADASQGSGGRVDITARGVFGIEPRANRTPLSDITASSQEGVSGVVSLNSLDTSFIQNDLSNLPEVPNDQENLVANSCVARPQQADGTFTISGGNSAEDPNSTLATSYPLGNVRTVTESNQVAASLWQSEDVVEEPQNVYRLADGRLVMSRECL